MTDPASKINILFLLQGLKVGGMEKMAVDLANSLPKYYRKTICCYDSSGPFEKMVDSDSRVLLMKRKPGFDLGFVVNLFRLLKTNKIDILHAHNNTAFFYGSIAAFFAGVKRVVYTEHGRTGKMSWMARTAHRLLSRLVYRTVVVADYLKEKLVREEGFPSSRITFIPNGINGKYYSSKEVRSSLRDELDIKENHKMAGIVARLDPVKNHTVLLEAMKKVIRSESGLKLLIVGDGPERDRLQKMVDDYQLNGSVLFLGERQDIPRIMSSLDLFVLTSFSEGMSITLIEAMAAGLPIIATDVGGNRRLIESDENGLLIPSDDIDALMKAMLKILGDRDLSRRLGQNAQDRFKKEFDIDRMVSRYQAIYEA